MGMSSGGSKERPRHQRGRRRGRVGGLVSRPPHSTPQRGDDGVYLARPTGRSSRSPKEEALDESMPYLVIGVAVLGLGVYAVVGQLALYAGRVPLWILLASVGSVMILGGTLSTLTYDDFEGISVDPANIGPEQVLVPRQEWLDLKRLRDQDGSSRENSRTATPPTWTLAHPSDTLLASPAPPAPAGPPMAAPSRMKETPIRKPTRETESVSHHESDTPVSRSPTDAAEDLVRLVQSLDRDSRRTDQPHLRPPVEQKPRAVMPTERQNRGQETRPVDAASSPTERFPTLALNRGSLASESLRIDPLQVRSAQEPRTPTLNPILSPPPQLGSAPNRPEDANSGRASRLGSRLRERGGNPCVGCGKSISSAEAPKCESCDLALCPDCLELGRHEGHSTLCPTCAMLLHESDGA